MIREARRFHRLPRCNLRCSIPLLIFTSCMFLLMRYVFPTAFFFFHCRMDCFQGEREAERAALATIKEELRKENEEVGWGLALIYPVCIHTFLPPSCFAGVTPKRLAAGNYCRSPRTRVFVRNRWLVLKGEAIAATRSGRCQMQTMALTIRALTSGLTFGHHHRRRCVCPPP